MKTVKDCYVTLETVRIGFQSSSHPFVVYLRFTDGTNSAPINNASLRDCMICGNSMLSAVAAVGVRYETVNVVFDERFDK